MDSIIMVQRVANGFIVTPDSPDPRYVVDPGDICVAVNVEELLAVVKSWANRSDKPLSK